MFASARAFRPLFRLPELLPDTRFDASVRDPVLTCLFPSENICDQGLLSNNNNIGIPSLQRFQKGGYKLPTKLRSSAPSRHGLEKVFGEIRHMEGERGMGRGGGWGWGE